MKRAGVGRGAASARASLAALALVAGGCGRRPASARDGAEPRASASAGSAASADAGGASARPAIADQPAVDGGGGGVAACARDALGCTPPDDAWRAWQSGAYERLLAARSLIEGCAGARRGRLAALAPGDQGACVCRVLCGLRFAALPPGTSVADARLPFAGVGRYAFDIRADGAVRGCDAADAPGNPGSARVECGGVSSPP